MEITARPGPGQSDENFVHPLECGHEHDAPQQLATGTAVRCSMHGPTRVAPYQGWREGLGYVGRFGADERDPFEGIPHWDEEAGDFQ